jgi:GT2 family glycosyltransferase
LLMPKCIKMAKSNTDGLNQTQAETASASVSVIIPNYNGRKHLELCLASLAELEYPQGLLTIIVVDNGSTDDSAEWVTHNFPEVKLVRSETNLGFSRGVNLGASVAQSEYLAFLNNDMRVDRRWLTALLKAAQSDERVACVGSKVLNWDGSAIDFFGRAADAFSLSYDPTLSIAATPAVVDGAQPALFVSGGAALIRRQVFEELGGFDAGFFMYHEDVDLGWRLWLRGYRCVLAEESLVYHRGGASARVLSASYLQELSQKHTLCSVFKNLEQDNLSKFLPLLFFFLLTRARWYPVAQESLATVIEEFQAELEAQLAKRAEVQRSRVSSDAEIFAQTGHPFAFLLDQERYQQVWKELLEHCPEPEFDGAQAWRRNLLAWLSAAQFLHQRQLLDEVVRREQELTALSTQFAEQQRTITELSAQVERFDAIWQTQLAEQQSSREQLTALLAEQQSSREQLTALLAEQQSSREQLTALLAEQQSSREQSTALLAKQQSSREQLTALLAEQQQQMGTLTTRLITQQEELAQSSAQLAAQRAESEQVTRARAAQLNERQRTIEKMQAQVAEQQAKTKTLVAQLAARQRDFQILQQSILFRLLQAYWRARHALRWRLQAGYAALRRVLRSLIAYRWRRRLIQSVSVRRPIGFAWRLNLKLFKVFLQFSAAAPKSLKLAFTLQVAPPEQSRSTSPAAALSASEALLVAGETKADLAFAAEAAHQPARRSAAAYDIFCFPIIDWEFRFQRPQQLLTQFARAGHRVFYLRTTFQQNQPEVVQQPIAEHVTGLQMPGSVGLNVYQHQLSETDLGELLQALDEFRLAANVATAVSLVQLPFWAPLANAARERWGWKVIYDCMDEHSGFSTNTPAMLDQENDLISSSDLVIATARLLHAKTAQLATRTLLLPNAADFEHFNQPGPEQLLANLPKPIIGYYGAISDWFDVELVRQAALARPQWQFVLIGDTFGADTRALKELSNVHFLGEQPYSSLPAYLADFDVACIPFLLTPLTQATNPVKFYEYLSAGKPVVAVTLPELEPFRDYFYPVDELTQFVPQLEAALAEQSPAAVQRRIDFARRQTWQARYQVLDRVVPQLYGKAAVIIVSYNNLDYLKQCLESIWAKTVYPNFEVLVVDNGSQPEVVEYLLASARNEPRLKVILNGQNLGFAAANNVGIEAAGQCEYVVLLNNDTVVTRGWLSKLVHYLADPSVGMVGPVTNSIGNEARINVAYQDVSQMDEFAAAYTREHAGESFEIAVLAMYCVALRKSLLDQLGPLDERFGVGMFEDDDYALRLRRAGYRLLCAEDIFVHHWGGASFKKIEQGEYNRIFEENLRKFEEKWGEPWKPHRYRAGVQA